MPSDLPAYSIPSLLATYKFGLCVFRNVFNLAKVSTLAEAGYIEYIKGTEPKNLLVLLTEKGSDFVERYALAILKNYSPFYTYPIIKPGDRIDVTTTKLGFSNGAGIVLVDAQKGVHVIHNIDRNSIYMSHENTSYKPIRITMKPSRDHLKFITDLDYTIKEFNNRLGKVVIRTILDKTDGLFNGLLIADQLDKLYKKSYVKSRLKKT